MCHCTLQQITVFQVSESNRSSRAAQIGDGKEQFASSPPLTRGGPFPEVVCCALLPEAHGFLLC